MLTEPKRQSRLILPGWVTIAADRFTVPAVGKDVSVEKLSGKSWTDKLTDQFSLDFTLIQSELRAGLTQEEGGGGGGGGPDQRQLA